MPTDESYLDSLLNGLTSNGNEPDDKDRFSAYKKNSKKKTENKEIRVTPEVEETPADEVINDAAAGSKAELHDIPNFLDAYISPKDDNKDEEVDDKNAEEHDVDSSDYSFDDSPSFVPEVDDEITEDHEPDVNFQTGEIENYNIFDDYDDAVIDKMINDELSEEGASGELFAMPEENSDEPETEEESIIPEEPFGEGNEPSEESEDNALTDLFFNEGDGKKDLDNDDYEEGSALDSLFGNLNQDTDKYENNGNDLFDKGSDDDDIDYDKFDFFEGVTDNPIPGNQMENHLADEVFNIESDDADDVVNKPELADSEDIFSMNDSAQEPGVFNEDGTPYDNGLDIDNQSNPVKVETPEYIFGESDSDSEGMVNNDNAEEAFDFLNSNSEETPEENADNFVAEYEDPMSGFSIDSGADNSNLSSMLGDMGVDSFNEDDLAALDDLLNEIDTDKEDEDKPVKSKKAAIEKDKLPWYIQLFGNVKIPENKIKPEIPPEELAKQKAEAAEAKKALREAKAAEKAEKKKAAAEAKALKARQTAEEKEAARKKKLEQASEMILEDVGNTTKLNKWGILVIFALFIGIVAVTVSGGSTLAYNIGIRQASKLFNNALVYKDVSYYTRAYDKIYGLEIEEEDYELYDKILTINYVNTQLNAYSNHVFLDDYREGLNDLFKGLLRFRKWFAHATALGAQDDIYLVRSEIYKKLWDIYGINEDEAMFVLEHYDLLKENYSEEDANLYYTRYIYETVDRLGLGQGSTQ